MNDESIFSDEMLIQGLNHSLLSRDEERNLLKRAQMGDLDSTQAILDHNERLVYQMARKYYETGSCGDQQLTDLCQWGRMGVMNAIRKFDLESPYKFSTYAFQWIRAYIQRYGIRSGNPLKISANDHYHYGRIYSARIRLAQELHRTPTPEEIAEETGYSVRYITSAEMRFISLDDPDYARRANPNDMDGKELGEAITDELSDTVEDAGEKMVLGGRALEELEKLPPTWQKIVRARYIEQPTRTLADIGCEMGITRERVRQIEERALDRIREALTIPSLFG